MPDEQIVLLSRSDILDINDIPSEVIDVPEWNNGSTAKVRVRGLTAEERDDFESDILVKNEKTGDREQDTRNIRAKLLARTICDNNFQRIFTDEDIQALGRKSAAAMDRVYTRAAALSKLSASDVEELAKNSGTEASAESSLSLQ